MDITLTRRGAKKNSVQEKVKRKVDAAKRYTAAKIAWMVVALQGALLLTLAVTEADPTPARGKLTEAVWAATHKPVFYPLIALLIGGPLLTLLAFRWKGLHRSMLLIAWPAFLAVLLLFFEERVRIMLRVLAWEYL